MRYFQISNGLHGCLWDYSTAIACDSIKDLADALKAHYDDVADPGFDEADSPPMTDAEALDWARQAWRTKGYLPISADVGKGSYCVAVNPCTATEAHEINEFMP